MSWKRAVALIATVIALFLATQPRALAYRGDRVPAASRGITGTTAKNYRTHVWTTIIGTYGYYRIIRHGGHRHRVAFRGITVSAQRCKRTGCWGKAVEGRLWSPFQHGRRPHRAARSGGEPQAGAQQDFCLGPGSTQCAAPWNWAINDPATKVLTAMRKQVAQPCLIGSLAGYGVKVAESTAGMAFAEGAVLTTAERAADLFGPEGFAVGTLAGCFVGIGAHGVSEIAKIVSALNPFDRSARWHTRTHRSR